MPNKQEKMTTQIGSIYDKQVQVSMLSTMLGLITKLSSFSQIIMQLLLNGKLKVAAPHDISKYCTP